MDLITAPSEHALLVFWVQIVLLLAAARGLGLLMRTIGQPSVVGELGAGLLLGPSVFGKLAPDQFAWLFPVDAVQSSMLFTVGWVGIALLLIITGFETDVALIRSLGRAAALVAGASILIPLAFGIATGFAMPSLFIGDLDDRTIFVLFMGTALSVSSLAVIAKVLTELGLMRRNFGQVTLAAGMANDLVGWIALGLIAGLAQSGRLSLGDLGFTLLGITTFLVLAATLGQMVVDFTLRTLRRVGAGITGSVTIIAGVSLTAGVVTQALGVEALLGAFVGGILFGRSRYRRHDVETHLESITLGVFAPIFFATAGLRVDLGVLGRSDVMWWGLLVLGVAIVSKFIGAYAGARRAGLTVREGMALGAGLNARGTLEIVIATVGLSLGVLNDASYAVIVLIPMVTSIMAPPMLRLIVSDWRGSPEEEQRLQREESLSRNVLVRSSRALIPSRGNPGSIAAAQLLHHAWPSEAEVTILSVTDDGGQPDIAGVRAIFAERSVEVRHIKRQTAADAVRRQAGLGYGLLTVGVERAGLGEHTISPLVDELLGTTPIPMMVVRPASDESPSSSYRKILVPVTGTATSRAALEVTLAVAARLRAQVLLLHVVTATTTGEMPVVQPQRRFLPQRPPQARSDVAERIIREALGFAEEAGVEARRVVRESTSPAEEILQVAGEYGVDLVVMGANLRSAEGRPFLGHNVEAVFEGADAAVAVVTLPSTGANGT